MSFFFLNTLNNNERLLWCLHNKRWSFYKRVDEQKDAYSAWSKAKQIKEGDVVFLYSATREIYAYGYVKKELDPKYNKEYEAPIKGNPQVNGIIRDSVFFVDIKEKLWDCWTDQLSVDNWHILKNKDSHDITLKRGEVIKKLTKEEEKKITGIL